MQDASSNQQKLKVCMHVRGVARLDQRVIRSASALIEAGFLVHVIDVENESTRPEEENICGIYIKHIHKPEWLVPTQFPIRLIKSVEKFIYSTFYLLRTSADIYHANNEDVLLPCFIAAQLRGTPLIFEAYEMPLYILENTNRRWAAIIKAVFKAIVQKCAGVIVVSPPIVEEVRKLYHVSNVSLIRNIPPYRAVTKSNRLRDFLDLSSTTRIVLYQGNLQPDRCLDRLVRATKFLSPDIVIVLMGKGVGSTPSELETLAIQEGNADQLKIIPPVPQDELLEWTVSADIGIIISSPEYSRNTRVFLPNKLFEYMMAGLPVLSSPLIAIEEIINTYHVGCVLTSLEPAAIAAEIQTMLADSTSLDYMHKSALCAAQQKFYWEKESHHLLQLYYNVLSKNKNRLVSKTLQILENKLSIEGVL
jgi:glycosyltransferase involved in cell wall biosynthesis